MWLLSGDILQIVFLAIIFIVSISIHEYAHARTSVKLGDPTPKIDGRLTPNPLVHIDPIGFLLIFIINFGRWRPVRVNPSYYKNTLRDELLVALAWPASNLILSIAGTMIMVLYIKIIGTDAYFNGTADPIVQFWFLFSWINIALAVFNLIPLPPLDGYRIVKYLKPMRGFRLEKNMRIIAIVFLVLILLPNPIGGQIGSVIMHVSRVIYGIIHALVTFIIR